MQSIKNKISPIKALPLRHPGQSLEEELYDILYAEIMPLAFGIFMIFFVAFYDLVRLYFNTPPQPLLWLLVGIGICIYYYKKLHILWRRFQNVKLGRNGERIVGQYLDEELQKNGYTVFHDLINGQFNIDHILVGSGGVYAIETKTRSITNGDYNVIFNGKEIVIDGYGDAYPIYEAKNHADWLKKFILDNAETEVTVKPVIIYAGDRFVKQTVPSADIWVLNVKALPTYLANEKSQLNAEQIKLISTHISSYIRNYRDAKE